VELQRSVGAVLGLECQVGVMAAPHYSSSSGTRRNKTLSCTNLDYFWGAAST
jgi:hypothetical protein